jgi:hypothetical protein
MAEDEIQYELGGVGNREDLVDPAVPDADGSKPEDKRRHRHAHGHHGPYARLALSVLKKV